MTGHPHTSGNQFLLGPTITLGPFLRLTAALCQFQLRPIP
jgi:hypothetical protein